MPRQYLRLATLHDRLASLSSDVASTDKLLGMRSRRGASAEADNTSESKFHKTIARSRRSPRLSKCSAISEECSGGDLTGLQLRRDRRAFRNAVAVQGDLDGPKSGSGLRTSLRNTSRRSLIISRDNISRTKTSCWETLMDQMVLGGV